MMEVHRGVNHIHYDIPNEKNFTQVHHFKWDYSVLQRLKEVSKSTANESLQ